MGLENFGEDGLFILETDKTDAVPMISILDFIDYHDGNRVLHLATHGRTNGQMEWDIFGSGHITSAQAMIASLASAGFETNPLDPNPDVLLTGGSSYYTIELTKDGVLDYDFWLGQFAEQTMVVAWYSHAMDHTTDSWLDIPQVTSMVGKPDSLHDNYGWGRLYFGLGCLYLLDGNDGTIQWALDFANDLTTHPLEADGDLLNSYDCTRTCADLPPAWIERTQEAYELNGESPGFLGSVTSNRSLNGDKDG